MQYFTPNPTLEILVYVLSCCVSVIAQHKILTRSAVVSNEVADGRAKWKSAQVGTGYACGQISLCTSWSPIQIHTTGA